MVFSSQDFCSLTLLCVLRVFACYRFLTTSNYQPRIKRNVAERYRNVTHDALVSCMLQEMTEMVWNCVYAAVACEPLLGPFAFTTVRVDPLLRSFVPITFSKLKKKLKNKKKDPGRPWPRVLAT